jgi:hypothetical protein
MADIVTVVLTTGQELVGRLIEENAMYVVLEEPMVFQQLRHPETGQIVAGMGEWPALADPKANKRYRIPITALCLMPAVPHEEVQRQYQSSTSGLTLPPVTPKILHG